LQLFGRCSYDLLLVDLRMPGMTGIEMLREVRRICPEFPPAVIITAYGIPEQLLEAAELGAIDYVRKPFSIQTIRQTVRDILERNEAGESEKREPNAQDHLLHAKSELRVGHRNAARAALQRALESDPHLTEAHFLLGVCSLLDHENENAREHFRTALTKDPTNKSAAEYLAWMAEASI
jgi:DNA-binding response OmpR family regulator